MTARLLEAAQREPSSSPQCTCRDLLAPGPRAYAAAVGAVRGLAALGLVDAARYWSATDRAAWAALSFAFGREGSTSSSADDASPTVGDDDDATYCGAYLGPEACTLEALEADSGLGAQWVANFGDAARACGLDAHTTRRAVLAASRAHAADLARRHGRALQCPSFGDEQYEPPTTRHQDDAGDVVRFVTPRRETLPFVLISAAMRPSSVPPLGGLVRRVKGQRRRHRRDDTDTVPLVVTPLYAGSKLAPSRVAFCPGTTTTTPGRPSDDASYACVDACSAPPDEHREEEEQHPSEDDSSGVVEIEVGGLVSTFAFGKEAVRGSSFEYYSKEARGTVDVRRGADEPWFGLDRAAAAAVAPPGGRARSDDDDDRESHSTTTWADATCGCFEAPPANEDGDHGGGGDASTRSSSSLGIYWATDDVAGNNNPNTVAVFAPPARSASLVACRDFDIVAPVFDRGALVPLLQRRVERVLLVYPARGPPRGVGLRRDLGPYFLGTTGGHRVFEPTAWDALLDALTTRAAQHQTCALASLDVATVDNARLGVRGGRRVRLAVLYVGFDRGAVDAATLLHAHSAWFNRLPRATRRYLVRHDLEFPEYHRHHRGGALSATQVNLLANFVAFHLVHHHRDVLIQLLRHEGRAASEGGTEAGEEDSAPPPPPPVNVS
mmetsp:Transcript_9455/g.38641  ORF Transcript_9455/g.38641 Transcript_9455/m.38641 type:complete len:666 (+) Transcript_9455:408-2405(+)